MSNIHPCDSLVHNDCEGNIKFISWKGKFDQTVGSNSLCNFHFQIIITDPDYNYLYNFQDISQEEFESMKVITL